MNIKENGDNVKKNTDLDLVTIAVYSEIEDLVGMAVDLEIQSLVGKDVIHLFVSLENWFIDSPNGFIRHCEARKDQKELGGLSFTQELNKSRLTIKKALKKLCLQYKSREDFDLAADKFNGWYYCSVYEQSNHRRTFYYRNHRKFAEMKKEWVKDLISSVNSQNQDSGLKQ